MREFMQDVVKKLNLWFHIAYVSGGECAVELSGKAHFVQDIFGAVSFLVGGKVTGDAMLPELLRDSQEWQVGLMFGDEPVAEEIVYRVLPAPLLQVKEKLLLEVGPPHQAIAKWPSKERNGDIRRYAVIARKTPSKWLVR
jgi:hypothetical protein